jgi:hypothetical protein
MGSRRPGPESDAHTAHDESTINGLMGASLHDSSCFSSGSEDRRRIAKGAKGAKFAKGFVFRVGKENSIWRSWRRLAALATWFFSLIF